MADVEIIKDILSDALKKEKMAEENCIAILEQLQVNGYHKAVEKIENDEKRHQVIVRELIDML